MLLPATNQRLGRYGGSNGGGPGGAMPLGGGGDNNTGGNLVLGSAGAGGSVSHVVGASTQPGGAATYHHYPPPGVVVGSNVGRHASVHTSLSTGPLPVAAMKKLHGGAAARPHLHAYDHSRAAPAFLPANGGASNRLSAAARIAAPSTAATVPGSYFASSRTAGGALAVKLNAQFVPVKIRKNIRQTTGFFCPHCFLPMSQRYRLPCYHIACGACATEIRAAAECPICQAAVVSIELLNSRCELFECPESDCRRYFLSLPSLQYHGLMVHQLPRLEQQQLLLQKQQGEPGISAASAEQEAQQLLEGFRRGSLLAPHAATSAVVASCLPEHDAAAATLESTASESQDLRSSTAVTAAVDGSCEQLMMEDDAALTTGATATETSRVASALPGSSDIKASSSSANDHTSSNTTDASAGAATPSPATTQAMLPQHQQLQVKEVEQHGPLWLGGDVKFPTSENNTSIGGTSLDDGGMLQLLQHQHQLQDHQRTAAPLEDDDEDLDALM